MMDDTGWMRLAIAEAAKAPEHGDVPVGALVVRDGQIIGRGHNRREIDRDPTAHAEVIAIREAAAAVGSWRIDRATLYVTLEPCPMCAGALVLARIPRLVYAAIDPKAGAVGSIMDVARNPRLNHRLEVDVGILADEAGAQLRDFFTSLRN